jgi:DHA2 family multidrug resistance protein
MSGASDPTLNAEDYAPPRPGTRAMFLLNIGYFAMVIGMFMAILDIQIVASSIAQIQAGVSASADEVAWIQTSYLIAEVIGIPLSGMLNRAFGMRRVFVYSCAAFTATSALCALAWSLESLIVFRVLQGFVGAAMIPTAIAAGFTLFGPNRSMLQQVMIGMVATLAPSLGPTLGGWITEHLSWHWLFLVNIIPGVIACIAVWRLIPGSPLNVSVIRYLDFIGLAAMALFLGSFEWVFEEGPAAGWFEDGELVIWMWVCLIAGVVFFWRAFRHPNPIVDLTIFANRNFAIGAASITVIGFGLFGSVYLTPLFLGQVRGFNALQIGQIMSVGGIAMFLGGPTAGALVRRYDPRHVLAFGLACCGFGLGWNAFLTAETGFWQLFWPQIFRGFGLITCMVAANFLSLGMIPPARMPNATGLTTVCRNLGGAIGLAALNTMRLTYGNMHTQEIAAGLDPTRPDVAAWLAQAEQRLRLLGQPDPHSEALLQLARRVQMESAVMTFNNMFMAMAIAFMAMVLLVPLIRRPAALSGSGALREAH